MNPDQNEAQVPGERNAVAGCEPFPGRPEDLGFEVTDVEGGAVGVWVFRENPREDDSA